jgi:arylsulfatase A-like enzyme
VGPLLSEAGYDCGYGGKWHVTSYADEAELAEHGFEQYCGFDDHGLADACVEFVEREREAPFFAVASFDNPHNICEWARDQHLPWGDVARPPVEECPPLPRNFAPPAYEPAAIRPAMDERRATWGAMVDADADEWRQYRHAFYRLVERVDESVGRILDGLDAAGVADETVVVFASDHGDMHGAHRMNQKGWLYEESVRVPLIVRAPDGDAGRIDDRLVSLLDLLPTLCDYAGASTPESARGRSLRPVVEDQEVDDWRDHLVVETGRPLDGRLVRTADYKYCVYRRGRNREQLFAMDGDRDELVDLATSAAHRDVLDEHRRLLLDWADRTDDDLIPGRMLRESALRDA